MAWNKSQHTSCPGSIGEGQSLTGRGGSAGLGFGLGEVLAGVRISEAWGKKE